MPYTPDPDSELTELERKLKALRSAHEDLFKGTKGVPVGSEESEAEKAKYKGKSILELKD